MIEEKKFRIHVDKDPARAATAKMNELFEKAHHASEQSGTPQPMLILFSGGTVLDLTKHMEGKYIKDHVTISVVDERYTSNPQINNFAKLSRSTFFREALKNGAHTIDTRPREKETHGELAGRMEHSFRNWRQAHPDGKIIALLGIGEDGHTAGVLPNEDMGSFLGSFEDQEHWITAYRAMASQTEHVDRVTSTLAFLRFQVDYALVYLVGEEKRKAFEDMLSGYGTMSETPSRIIPTMKDVDVYTDIEVS